MIKFRKLAAVAAVTLGVLAIAPVSQAADAYPSQPLKLLVPFPPGGGTDTMARFVANALTEEFKWNVEIGRASGRESVCQYVEISVGAVSLEKKREEKRTIKKAKI